MNIKHFSRVIAFTLCLISPLFGDDAVFYSHMPGAIGEFSEALYDGLENNLDPMLHEDGLPIPNPPYDVYLMPTSTTPQDVWNFYANQMGVMDYHYVDWGEGVQSAVFVRPGKPDFYIVYMPFQGYLGIFAFEPDAGPGELDSAEGPDTPFVPLEWDVWCDFNQSIFPSYILATAVLQTPPSDQSGSPIVFLGDPNGRLGVMVHHAGGSHYKVTLKKNSIMEESTFSGVIPDHAETAFIQPKALYDYEALRGFKQTMPLNLVATLQIDGGEPQQKALTVTVRSIYECLFGRLMVVNGEGEAMEPQQYYEDLSFMFAAYVNENHPGVEKILKQALDAGVVDTFSGYLGASQDNPSAGYDAVIGQVFAIWNVLQRNGVKYSNITATQSEDFSIYSQHVRFLNDVINNTQANCIDGTALFASVLRKIGIEPFLVLIPGHAFLAFSLDGTDQLLLGLETTMLGNTTLKSVENANKNVSDELRENMKNEASWASFDQAVNYGTEALKQAMDKIARQEDARYKLISISMARQLGILPIAFHQN